MRIVLGAVMACILPLGASAAHFGDALAHYFLENYEAAHAEWQVLAAEGDRSSQFYLGLLYETGRGVAADTDTAVRWYQKAAEAGHGEAAYRLALLARQSDDLPAEPETVLNWIKQAAEGGVAEAQYELGAVYAEGKLVDRDFEKARQWFSAAEDALPQGPKRRQAAEMRRTIEARLAP